MWSVPHLNETERARRRTTAATSIDIIGKQAAYSQLHTEMDREFFFFQAEDGIRDVAVTGVQTCALPISGRAGIHRPTETTRAPRARAAPPRAERTARLRPCGASAGPRGSRSPVGCATGPTPPRRPPPRRPRRPGASDSGPWAAARLPRPPRSAPAAPRATQLTP